MSQEIKVTRKQTELKVFSVEVIGRHMYKDIAVQAVSGALSYAGYLSIHEDSAPSKLATSLDVYVSIPEEATLPNDVEPCANVMKGTCAENDKLLFIEFQYNEAFASLVDDQKNTWYSNAIAEAVSEFVKSVPVPKATKTSAELQDEDLTPTVVTPCYWVAKHKEALNKLGIQVHAIKDSSVFTEVDSFDSLKFHSVLHEIAKVWSDCVVVPVRDHFAKGVLVRIPGQVWSLYLQ